MFTAGFEKAAGILRTGTPQVAKAPHMPMPKTIGPKPPRYNDGSGNSQIKLFRSGRSKPDAIKRPAGIPTPNAYNPARSL